MWGGQAQALGVCVSGGCDCDLALVVVLFCGDFLRFQMVNDVTCKISLIFWGLHRAQL